MQRMKVYIDRGRAAKRLPAIVVEWPDGKIEYCRKLEGQGADFVLVQSEDMTAKPHIWIEVESGNFLLTGQ